MTLSVTRVGSDGLARIQVTGELDMATAPELNAAIDELVDGGEQRILIDLSGLDFCDSTGLASFVRGDHLAARGGGWLRLIGADGRVARVLRMSGLEQVLTYDHTVVDPAAMRDS